MSTEFGARCKECGAHAVHPHARPGRTYKYRELVTLPVPSNFAVPTCGHCGGLHYDAATVAALLPRLDAEYRLLLRLRIRQVLERLSTHVSQRRLEHVLGLSQGYLSRLRSGSGIPSTELVSHLALLANDPAARLHELEHFWGQPVTEEALNGVGETRALANSPSQSANKEDVDPAS